ncbi:Hypothetical_protein [Hexamita inflata]|uniref:Hypothetical_protein n=1 Tax=Hexamita inflata TaxID=28002 RepID=A0AA86UNK5_9EUKA|nr:Hypothetical protein HINF_LOCUS49709 [Hexamita inflata]
MYDSQKTYDQEKLHNKQYFKNDFSILVQITAQISLDIIIHKSDTYSVSTVTHILFDCRLTKFQLTAKSRFILFLLSGECRKLEGVLKDEATKQVNNLAVSQLMVLISYVYISSLSK